MEVRQAFRQTDYLLSSQGLYCKRGVFGLEEWEHAGLMHGFMQGLCRAQTGKELAHLLDAPL